MKANFTLIVVLAIAACLHSKYSYVSTAKLLLPILSIDYFRNTQIAHHISLTVNKIVQLHIFTKNPVNTKQVINSTAIICSITYAITKFVESLRKWKSLRITTLALCFGKMDTSSTKFINILVSKRNFLRYSSLFVSSQSKLDYIILPISWSK